MKFEILDCTLRDGSYVNNFQFSASETYNLVKSLDGSGVDMIEVGHGIGLGASRGAYTRALESDEKYMEATAKAIGKSRWGVFCIPGIASLDDLVIASDYDYHMPLAGNSKYLGLIPNPINTSKLSVFELDTKGPIVIFMGINRTNYHSKGISYFEKAIAIIQQKFPKQVHIEIVENLPYAQYIEKYNNAHIILDQVFAYDQGYNALEAMAKAKVVFTGAESGFMEHYKLDSPVAINALPDVDSLVLALEDLIKHPEKIKEIGMAAQNFVTQHHNYKKVAQLYLDTWKLSRL